MKELLNEWRKYLLIESGLSRVYEHIMEHDCAIITAHRANPLDTSKCIDSSQPEQSAQQTNSDLDEAISNKEKINSLNNRDLKGFLLSKKYGVTKVDGSYIENFETPEAIEVKEDSLFVVNLSDERDFLSTIEKLGQKYCQDSILFILKGGENAFLLGTNKSDFPGLGNKIDLGGIKIGEEAQFMTKVRERPFSFKENLEIYENLSRLEKMAVVAIAKKILL